MSSKDSFLFKNVIFLLQESSRYVEANSNLFRNVDACKGASNAAVTPHAIVTGYQGNDNGTDQLRTFRTDLLLGGTDLVRNNLLFHGINISRIDTLGLLERWKELFYDVRNCNIKVLCYLCAVL